MCRSSKTRIRTSDYEKNSNSSVSNNDDSFKISENWPILGNLKSTWFSHSLFGYFEFLWGGSSSFYRSQHCHRFPENCSTTKITITAPISVIGTCSGPVSSTCIWYFNKINNYSMKKIVFVFFNWSESRQYYMCIKCRNWINN